MLYLLRHGQTDWNAEHRLQGQRDVPLNAVGRAQARANGERLATIVPNREGLRFVASPLGRTRETMEIVRSALGLVPGDYATDERLLEITFGEWEGHTLEELWVDDPALVKGRKKEKWHFVPPGGESYAMLAERTVPVLEGLAGDTLVVSHGGTMRTLIRHLTDGDEQEWANFSIPQDRIWIWNGENGEWA